METLIVPDLALMRRWLEQLGVSFFECDSCQALHLPHLQNINGIFDAKVDLLENVILFSAVAEIRPVALIPLVADLSQINASSLTTKVFIDIQDDNLPKMVICQSLSVTAGITIEQFSLLLEEGEAQTTQIIMEARANELLTVSDNDEGEEDIQVISPVIHTLH
ncbi:YbjN domain-containing protein [Budvicia aquatica]|uniref:Bacterial sensory transduction regulator n=1 Tax=Budvicia aquatica TaxID=82979 RepID=A0A2C6DQ78_9GAMM|nr:YbjN domain-containing protein [Budvicia aquatica]MBP9643152.1 YbjN domain-containing protein [Budvicia sp.]PHI30843.1 YbjN domain-containing protein [Budvicia aquatica]VFS50641.1 Putative bacterial sensory transduction regulator [Budvicia aquatica]